MQTGGSNPKIIAFDLDGTLAPSFTPPDAAMIELMAQLSEHAPLSIMSAATFERIQSDILTPLLSHPKSVQPSVFSLNGAQCRIQEGSDWSLKYDFAFTPEDTETIERALRQVAITVDHLQSIEPKGSQIIDYKGYLAFTALGTDAPFEEKAAWDPDTSKRKEIKAIIEEQLPQYDVFIGGRTTIDIIPKGKNKRYAVEWLANYMNIQASEMLFVGDGLADGGNDSVVIPTGIQTHAVNNPTETAQIIQDLIASYTD
jgi:HAD superfamily hydrolase (TIGR01484 family)